MNKELINSIFAAQKNYSVNPLDENGYSLNNTSSGLYFFYYSEEQKNILYLFAQLSSLGNFSSENKLEICKKMLRLNLPTSSARPIRLGMTSDEYIFLSTVLDTNTLTKERLEHILADFFEDMNNYQNQLSAFAEDLDSTANTPSAPQEDVSVLYAINNFIKI